MITALILAGGKGLRIGSDVPKQYIQVGKRPIISYCLRTLACSNRIDAIWIVADRMRQDYIRSCMERDARLLGERILKKFRGFSEPGENRQLSIYNGICDVIKYIGVDGYILVHDAARPRLSMTLIKRCVDAADGHDGVIPVIPMKDTVYRSDDGKNITGLLERSTLYAGQAPELFSINKYYEANRTLIPDKILDINGSTEPAVLSGMDIVMVNGHESNYKITTASDLERFKSYVASLHI